MLGIEVRLVQLQSLKQSVPTQHPTSNEFSVGSGNFTAFDLGGHQSALYIVDAYDRDRFAESKRELDSLLSEEPLATVPFLILGNKMDIPDAVPEEELRFYLGLTNFTTGKGKIKMNHPNVRPIEVFMCSIARKMGYGQGFKWLSQYIE
ncbi:hypothetical protein ACLB2K_037279 [Fragaria x ananassa]